MKQIHKRVAALLLAAALTGLPVGASLLSPLGSQVVWAKGGETETEKTTKEQETEPAQTESETAKEQPEVKITISVPEGWQSKKVQAGIQVEDTKNTGNFSPVKVEARVSENGQW